MYTATFSTFSFPNIRIIESVGMLPGDLRAYGDGGTEPVESGTKFVL
jgi:hypothetical protein